MKNINLKSLIKEYTSDTENQDSIESPTTLPTKTSIDIANTILTQIKNTLNDNGTKGWKRAIKLYAIDLLEWFKQNNAKTPNTAFVEKEFLNGASNWREYSMDGNSLIYTEDIAERMCTDKQLKLVGRGKKEPSKHMTWIQLQGNALKQAFDLIMKYYSKEQI